MNTNEFGPFSGPGAVACAADCAPDLDFAALTKAQFGALGRIAIGCDLPVPHKRTIAALKAKRLIVEIPRLYPSGIGSVSMSVTRYGVPLCVHLAWCLSCSESEVTP